MIGLKCVDEQDIAFFFHGWNKVYVNEERMTRYKEEKILWRIVISIAD